MPELFLRRYVWLDPPHSFLVAERSGLTENIQGIPRYWILTRREGISKLDFESIQNLFIILKIENRIFHFFFLNSFDRTSVVHLLRGTSKFYSRLYRAKPGKFPPFISRTPSEDSNELVRFHDEFNRAPLSNNAIPPRVHHRGGNGHWDIGELSSYSYTVRSNSVGHVLRLDTFSTVRSTRI